MRGVQVQGDARMSDKLGRGIVNEVVIGRQENLQPEIHVEDLTQWEAISPDQLPRLRQLTAQADGREVGKVKLADRPICEKALRAAYPDTPMVYQLYVDEAARGQGVGSALMDAAEQMARADGKQAIILCVAPDNETARRLYESRGYKYTGETTVESIWELRDRTETVQLLPMIKVLDAHMGDGQGQV